MTETLAESKPGVELGQRGAVAGFRKERRRWDIVAIGLTVGYVLFFSTLSIARHEGLRTRMNDLGNMTQAIWGVSQGDWTMRVTNDPEEEIRSRLGVHANLFFYVLAIPFLLFPALTSHMEPLLLFGTSLACGLAGLGIYCRGIFNFRFARCDLDNSKIANEKSKMALWLAIAFWLNPMVHDANLYDFHVITFATALIVWMLWAWSAGWNKTGWVLFALALSCKEDVPAVLLMLATGEFFCGDRKRGLWMAGACIAYLVLVFGVVIPMANEGQTFPKVAAARLAWIGETPLECIVTILTKPWTVLAHGFSHDHIRLPMFLYLLGGIMGVFGGMRILVGVIPPVAVALLAGPDWMARVTGTYYWITSVALIYLSAVLALKRNAENAAFQKMTVGYLLGGSVVACLLFSQTPLGVFSKWSDYRIDARYRAALDEIKALVPSSASISAQNNIAAHFAKRRMVAVYPSQVKQAEFVIFHLRYPGGPEPVLFPSNSARLLLKMSSHEHERSVREFLNSPQWRKVYSRDGFFVFERAPNNGEKEDAAQGVEREMGLYMESLQEENPSRFERMIYDILGYRY